jgi:drug/metabolite transporter (DMT)-like permease
LRPNEYWIAVLARHADGESFRFESRDTDRSEVGRTQHLCPDECVSVVMIRRYSALETATYSTAIAVPLLALGMPVEWYVTGGTVPTIPITFPGLAAIGYLGVFSTAVSWYCWYKGLEFVDAGTVATFFFAQPVVGVILGALFLGDRFAPGFVVGGGLMCVGIYLVSTEAGIAE